MRHAHPRSAGKGAPHGTHELPAPGAAKEPCIRALEQPKEPWNRSLLTGSLLQTRVADMLQAAGVGPDQLYVHQVCARDQEGEREWRGERESERARGGARASES